MQEALRPGPLLPADAIVQEDTAAQLALEWLASPNGPQQHDGALIIYTSGTTGRPKGAWDQALLAACMCVRLCGLGAPLAAPSLTRFVSC